MEYQVEVRIELKPGVVDAEGETVQKSLGLLGFSVVAVRSIRAYEISVTANSGQEAKDMMENACKRLLANPVVNNYSVEIKSGMGSV